MPGREEANMPFLALALGILPRSQMVELVGKPPLQAGRPERRSLTRLLLLALLEILIGAV